MTKKIGCLNAPERTNFLLSEMDLLCQWISAILGIKYSIIVNWSEVSVLFLF